MNTIKLKIQSAKDRENITVALANNGYKVWIEKEYQESNQQDFQGENSFYVIFELNN